MGKKKILVTGGTGFLGKYAVPLLREEFEVDVISRSNKSEVQGDLTQWDAGLDLEQLREKQYDLFLHMSGLYDLKALPVDCNQQNVNALGTALKLANALGVKAFINTSTVAAAINSPLKLVKPYDLQLTKSFPDAYSESKANGEELLKNWQSSQGMKKINLRLGVLVGDSVAGKIDRIDGPYYAMEAFSRLKVILKGMPTAIPLPGKEEGRIPLVPVDVAAKAILGFCRWSLEDREDPEYQSFHITPPAGVPVRELYQSMLKGLAISHKGITLVDSLGETILVQLSHHVAKLPKEELHYLLNFPNYDSSATQDILGADWCPSFAQYQQSLWRGYEAFVSNRGN